MSMIPDSPPDRLATLVESLKGLSGAEGPAALPPLAVLPQMALARGRLHEVAGPARRVLAALAAGVAAAEGPVVWLRPAWRSEGLNPLGLVGLMDDPGALVQVACPKAEDVLWGMEEALRAGCAALVVGELAEAPDLRQVRRLHLAAAEGVSRNRLAGRSRPAPLGLVLDTESAESRVPGVETRWALHPLPPAQGEEGRRWRLDRLLARSLPPRDWVMTGLRRPESAEVQPKRLLM